METLDSRLNALKILNSHQRLAVLVDTFVLCSETERDRIALDLIELAIGQDSPPPPARTGLIARLARTDRRPDREEDVADRALSELAHRWALLSHDLRRATIPLAAGRWPAAVGDVTPSSAELARRSAIKLAEDAREPGLARVCVDLLRDTEVPLAAAAGRALVTLAESAGSGGEAIESEVLRGILDIGVHRCRGAAVAAMVLLSPAVVRGPSGKRGALAAWLVGEETEAHAALRAALRTDRSAVSRDRAWEWLGLARLAAASGERLRALQGAEEFEPVLLRWHLIASPSRQREWRSLRAAGREAELPTGESATGLSVRARRGLIGLAAAQRDGSRSRIATIGAALGDPEPVIRLATVQAAGPDEQIDLCFDSDSRVARSAFLAWSVVGERGNDGRLIARFGVRTSPPRQRLLGKLSRSAHPWVRGSARDERRSTDWLDPGSPGGRTTAWAMMSADRAGTAAILREHIESKDDARRVGAIALVRRLGLAMECEDLLDGIVRTPSDSAVRDGTEGDRPSGPARARASAVMALGDVRTVRAVESLQSCLDDHEPRVRANAVEALGKTLVADAPSDQHLSSVARGAIDGLRSDDEHRTRANALRALIGAGPYIPSLPDRRVDRTLGGFVELKPLARNEHGLIEDLLAMLGDTRAMHRLAGTWLSGRLIWKRAPPDGAWTDGLGLTARLGELARGDADSRVRARAGRCLVSLRARMGDEPRSTLGRAEKKAGTESV